MKDKWAENYQILRKKMLTKKQNRNILYFGLKKIGRFAS